MNNDMNWWFAMATLCNTTIGLSNMERNVQQEEKQKQIEQKLDKILEILNNE